MALELVDLLELLECLVRVVDEQVGQLELGVVADKLVPGGLVPEGLVPVELVLVGLVLGELQLVARLLVAQEPEEQELVELVLEGHELVGLDLVAQEPVGLVPEELVLEEQKLGVPLETLELAAEVEPIELPEPLVSHDVPRRLRHDRHHPQHEDLHLPSPSTRCRR